MKNSDLFDVLRNLSNEEISEFDNYLKSPYFVKGKSLNKFFKEIINIREYLVDFEYEKLVFKLCKKLKYSKLTLGKQISYLSKEVINFLKQKSIEIDKYSVEINFNEYLLNRQSFSVLKSNLKKTAALLKNDLQIRDKTFLHSFRNNILNFTSNVECPRILFKTNLSDNHVYLDNALIDLTLFTLMQSSGIFINNVLLNLNLNDDERNSFLINLENIFLECDKSDLFKSSDERRIICDIYHKMYLTYYKKNNKLNFVRYKNIVDKSVLLLSKELIYFHYKVLINFCIMKERLGEEYDYYKRERVKLMYRYFNNNYFKTDESEFINQIEFKNFIISAFSIKQYENIKSFIENNSYKLNPVDFNDMVNYGYAYYYLGKKDYRKALKNLNDISEGIPIIKFDIRNIEMRIYFELGTIEPLINAIHNYRAIVLNDSTLTKSDKESLFAMLKYFNSLINVVGKTDKKEQIFLAEYNKQLIRKEQTFSLKNWLLEKFENIVSSKYIQKYSNL